MRSYTPKTIAIVDDIVKGLDHSKVEGALQIKDTQSRVGKIAYALYDAVVKSSISYYSGNYCYFNGWYYEQMSKEDFNNTIFELMRSLGVDSGDILFRGFTVIRLIDTVVKKRVLKYHSQRICFLNGVLNLEDMKFYNFSPDHHIFSSVEYIYDPEQDLPDYAYLWHKFLNEVLPDKDAQELLQEFLGLLFIDRSKVSIEAMLFMLGKGANGKSVIFKTITGLLGRNSVSNYDISSLVSDKEKLHNIAVINGKRLNYCSDMGDKDLKSENFKSLVAGEPQPARRMYSDPFTAYDIPFIIANGNKMPPTRDLTEGFFRRILILPFNVQIPLEQQNKDLADELRDEYPAIFNWIMRGRKRIVANEYQFTIPKVSYSAIRQYKAATNNIFEWIIDYKFRHHPVDIEVRRWVKATEVYNLYLSWCKRYDETALSNKVFANIMTEIGYERRRFSEGNAYLIYGIPDGKYTKIIVEEEMPLGMAKARKERFNKFVE